MKPGLTDYLMLTTGVSVAYYCPKQGWSFVVAGSIYYGMRQAAKLAKRYADRLPHLPDVHKIAEAGAMYYASTLMLKTGLILKPYNSVASYLTGVLGKSLSINSYMGLIYGVCSAYLWYCISNSHEIYTARLEGFLNAITVTANGLTDFLVPNQPDHALGVAPDHAPDHAPAPGDAAELGVALARLREAASAHVPLALASLAAADAALLNINRYNAVAPLRCRGMGNDLEQDVQCAVCQDDITGRSLYRQLPCNHIFHATCIDPWIERSNTCPLCRSPILVDHLE
jgi:hypothetical protein